MIRKFDALEKDCTFPDCFKCRHEDCVMEDNDIKKIRKFRNVETEIKYYNFFGALERVLSV